MDIEKGFVYFIEVEPEGPIKVGYTSGDPNNRLLQLQTGSPYKLNLIGYIEGDRTTEINFHSQLKNHRINGEWFDREKVLTIINKLNLKTKAFKSDFFSEYKNILFDLISNFESEENISSNSYWANKLVYLILSAFRHDLKDCELEKTFPFKKWLQSKINDDTIIGDLARDSKREKKFPRRGNFKTYLEYFNSLNLGFHEDLIVRSFLEAWIECEFEYKEKSMLNGNHYTTP